jgi:hypothetical protein
MLDAHLLIVTQQNVVVRPFLVQHAHPAMFLD